MGRGRAAHRVGRARRARALRGVLATAAAASATAALGRVALATLSRLDPAAGLLALPVDGVVTAAATLAGALAGLALTCGLTLLAASALLQVLAAGVAAPRVIDGVRRTAHLLETAGARLTPAVVRRVVGVTVTAGLGVGMTSGVALADEPQDAWPVTSQDVAVTWDAAAPDEDLARAWPVSEHPEDVTVPEVSAQHAARGPVTSADPVEGSGGAPPGDLDVARPMSPPPSAAVPSSEPWSAAPAAPPAAVPVVAPTGRGPSTLGGREGPGATAPSPVVPTPAPAATRPGAAAQAVSPDPSGATVVVQRGDTLWTIAAAHLPPGSSERAVAESWPRWYAANVAVIGSDPDLIQPGQQLTAPRDLFDDTAPQEQP